tara:strand:+ start:1881 stop:3122 length:1242 start_codon:yes stop_codon:yes gene_type:complete
MEDFDPVDVAEAQDDEMTAPFRPDQIIYSRADERGIVIFGNTTFREISGYRWEDLIGAPHKLIRHPDMPKGVFWLFWDRLKQGLPVVAYVKNRTKVGKHYWALALVAPCPGGYLSIRIRPQDSSRDQMAGIYSELRARETKENLKPERSAELFLEKLKEIGHSDYETFMRCTLDMEMNARASEIGKMERTRQEALDSILKLAEDSDGYVNRMSEGFRNVRAEPINMRILSNRMEDGGAAISSISQNYEVMAADMGQELAALNADDGQAFRHIRQTVAAGHFSLQAADLAAEAARELVSMRGELTAIGADTDGELAIIEQFANHSRNRANDSLKTIGAHAERLSETCRRLRRRINGLDVVKLMCRVESGRRKNADDALGGIIDRLAKFHLEIDRNLASLGRCAGGMTRNVRACR